MPAFNEHKAHGQADDERPTVQEKAEIMAARMVARFMFR